MNFGSTRLFKYYGFYSNVSRGKRRKAGTDEAVPCILDAQVDEKTFRRNWARLIHKIYEVDPLGCSKCRRPMWFISFIEDEEVVKAILDHLGPWIIRSRPPAKAHAPLLC